MLIDDDSTFNSLLLFTNTQLKSDATKRRKVLENTPSKSPKLYFGPYEHASAGVFICSNAGQVTACGFTELKKDEEATKKKKTNELDLKAFVIWRLNAAELF